MAKVGKVQHKSHSQRNRVNPYTLGPGILKDVHLKKKGSKAVEEKEWKDATCSVCMEYPHNAVLLLCSSYNKGCRPYMCATSHRYSNCLQQYKKAYTKVTSTCNVEPWHGSADNTGASLPSGCLNEKAEVSELLCPLCRGRVKGWTVVEPARNYLNTKKRTCMLDNCSFIGTYKQLRKHVKAEHPRARPREVDPSLAEKWKKLEHEREREDVISTIRSSMPGAIVMGDYVIERNYHGLSGNHNVDDYLGEAIFRLESFGGSVGSHISSHGIFESSYHSLNEEGVQMHRGRFDATYISRFARYRSRLLSGRSRQRRRHGETTTARNFA
ncbi:hypothetical protein NMG60_11017454 [Bertholletia excelsa]